MSKPLSHPDRLHLPVASPGAMVKHLVRMGLYWLCATTLLWSSQHPLAAWQLSTLLVFCVISSIVVPALGYLAMWFRGRDGNSPDSPPRSHEPPHSLADTLGQTGLIGAELLTTLVAATAVEQLLF